MRREPWLLAIGLLGLSGGCARPDGPLTPPHAAAIVDSVRGTLQSYVRHASTGDWDSLMVLYDADPGFHWVEEGKVVARSAEEIGSKIRGLPAGMRLDNSFTNTDIVAVSPGVAIVATAFQTTMRDTSGPTFSFGGALTMTLVHRPGGWRLLAGHSSSGARQ